MINKYPDSNEVEYLCKILGFEENVIRVSTSTSTSSKLLKNIDKKFDFFRFGFKINVLVTNYAKEHKRIIS